MLFRHEYSSAACGREEHDEPPDPRPLAPERRLQAQDETGQEEQAEVSNSNTILVLPVWWIQPHWFWSARSGSRRGKIYLKARKPWPPPSCARASATGSGWNRAGRASRGEQFKYNTGATCVVDPAALILVGQIRIQEGQNLPKSYETLTPSLLRQSVG